VLCVRLFTGGKITLVQDTYWFPVCGGNALATNQGLNETTWPPEPNNPFNYPIYLQNPNTTAHGKYTIVLNTPGVYTFCTAERLSDPMKKGYKYGSLFLPICSSPN